MKQSQGQMVKVTRSCDLAQKHQTYPVNVTR